MRTPTGTFLVAAACAVALVPGTNLGAQSIAGGSFGRWAASLEIDSRVPDELARFRDGGRRLPGSYVHELPAAARRDLVDRAERAVARLAKSGCEPSLDVSFDEPPAPERPEGRRSGVQEAFEESLLRIEMVACIASGEVDPDEALRIYTDPEFRRSVESRIERIWTEDGLSCVETAGVSGFLDPARACNRIERYRAPSAAAEHSQVVANRIPGDASYEIVYFKESLKTFVRIPGGVALHYAHLSRSADLGRLSRWIGAGRVRDAEERKVAALERALGG